MGQAKNVRKTTEEASDAPVETIRFLFPVPEPIERVGIELTNRVITSVKVAPSEKEREGYQWFLDLEEESEFFDEMFGRLSEYFSGARKKLELDYDLELHDMPRFHRRVLKETLKIPYGRTRTYGWIAEKLGRPESYRVVLAALVANPLPIVLPCHRVTTHKSGIGSYVGGQDAKRWLLTMEKEALKRPEI